MYTDRIIAELCPDAGDLCFTVSTDSVSWLAAEQACLQDDAELAHYDSIPAEVRQSLQQDALWVTQAGADQGFTWLDGTAVSGK